MSNENVIPREQNAPRGSRNWWYLPGWISELLWTSNNYVPFHSPFFWKGLLGWFNLFLTSMWRKAICFLSSQIFRASRNTSKPRPDLDDKNLDLEPETDSVIGWDSQGSWNTGGYELLGTREQTIVRSSGGLNKQHLLIFTPCGIPFPWIWAGLMPCFNSRNVAEVPLCEFRALRGTGSFCFGTVGSLRCHIWLLCQGDYVKRPEKSSAILAPSEPLAEFSQWVSDHHQNHQKLCPAKPSLDSRTVSKHKGYSFEPLRFGMVPIDTNR